MNTTESCSRCERMRATLTFASPVRSLLGLPNTFDKQAGKYAWEHRGEAAFVLVPQSVGETTGEVDMYLCVDEDELDDVDTEVLAAQLIHDRLLTRHPGMAVISMSGPSLVAPVDVGCWKLHHTALGERE